MVCDKANMLTEEETSVFNKHIRNDTDFNALKMTINTFEDCRKSLQETKEVVANLETICNNPEHYVNEYFEGIKRKVELRREDFKLRVDQYTNEVIKSINSTKNSYFILSKEIGRIAMEIEKSKKEVTSLIERFETYEIDDKKFKDIKQSADILRNKYNEMTMEHKRSLIGNKKYIFEFTDLPMSEVFGKVIECKFDSRIVVSPEAQADLNKLCEFPASQTWTLQYRASRDGFRASDFHSKCDGVPNTLTVIKSTNNNVFGGFTEKAWHSDGGYVSDPRAFIFSLINKEEKPFKAVCLNSGKYAIRCNSSFGPAFGGDLSNLDDLHVESDSNINTSSYSDFGCSFRHPDYSNGSDTARLVLAGSNYFQTVEIEVFSKIN